MKGSLYHSPLLAFMIAISHTMNMPKQIPRSTRRKRRPISGTKCRTTRSIVMTIHRANQTTVKPMDWNAWKRTKGILLWGSIASERIAGMTVILGDRRRVLREAGAGGSYRLHRTGWRQ